MLVDENTGSDGSIPVPLQGDGVYLAVCATRASGSPRDSAPRGWPRCCNLVRPQLTHGSRAGLAGSPSGHLRSADAGIRNGTADFPRNVGITADYVALLAERLGAKFENREYPSVEAAISAATAGHADFIGSIVATPERARQMDLSDPYLLGISLLLTRADDRRTSSAADLAGRRVAIESGIRRRQVLASAIPDIRFLEAKDATAAVELVRSGHADASLAPAWS